MFRENDPMGVRFQLSSGLGTPGNGFAAGLGDRGDMGEMGDAAKKGRTQ
jgi:hypothetical protein